MSRNGVRDTFFGRAGEMAVMAELLLRGWNVENQTRPPAEVITGIN